MESVRGESGRFGISFASSPTFDVSESSAVSIPSLGEEGMEGEGEEDAVFGSPGVPVILDLVEAVSDPPLQGKDRESALKHVYDINDR